MTGSVGSQTATDPDHRSADCAADASLRVARGDKSLLAHFTTLLAPALPISFSVVWVDQDLVVLHQHLEITSFQLVLSSHEGLRACATRSAVSGANRA